MKVSIESKVKFLATNPDLCLGCRSCELACGAGKAAKYTPEERNSKRPIVPSIIVTQAQGLNKKIPAYCRHCENSFCLQLCPAKAITREHGAVKINDDKCTGCGICEQGCPYGVITMTSYKVNERTKTLANKCDLCLDRQINDRTPLCYTACPTKAITLHS
ncbi:4Fe-4S dicluster domain-containing protein [Alkalicella caledoniensis]|uniref:4Fe-4S dicluster domain-containing protein n=1 Tax=Alkalicella caledoniensis TaxID=2731377 RepID=A0A7G9WAV1_ALKCA|nr:4Fe-4S dicluster domain-containing protein [Alkalicella caledoniensis]QNO15813.1 4Fe-4S dicluster domain-containing protein [Alkalicella caledoniensis]